ncbi:MAG: MFS transporter [candidate division Zixibacteria bacterium]|nr:MFS transporter [candidate division Zixibacteria bacterium]
MKRETGIFKKDVISWALYDFANTIYSMNILSLYFAGWLIVDLGYQDIHYSIAYSSSMVLAAILMPALGALSDKPGGRGLASQKKLFFLAIFTIGAVISVLLFSITPASLIIVVLIFFALSNFFFEGGMVFYNTLLDSVSKEDNIGKVSGFGVSLGYLGSIVGMLLVLPFVTGSLFSLEIPFLEGGGKSAAFLPTAFLYAIFAIPIFLFVREKPAPKTKELQKSSTGIIAAYKGIWQTIKSSEKYPGLMRFLISDYFFEDAIATVIIFMAVFTERVLGLTADDRTLFFIVSTVFAMVGAYIFGMLADKYSPKKILSLLVSGWILILLAFTFNSEPAIFWILGPIVGMLLGGVWAVSRPLLMILSPKEKLGEMFGLFSLSGRAAAICGPLMWGAVVWFFKKGNFAGDYLSSMLNLSVEESEKLPYRLAVLSLAGMMAVGLYIFRKVPERKIDSAK